jgi:hypothetical protein
MTDLMEDTAQAALERVKGYIVGMRRIADATMFPDYREILTATADDLEGLIAGEESWNWRCSWTGPSTGTRSWHGSRTCSLRSVRSHSLLPLGN